RTSYLSMRRPSSSSRSSSARAAQRTGKPAGGQPKPASPLSPPARSAANAKLYFLVAAACGLASFAAYGQITGEKANAPAASTPHQTLPVQRPKARHSRNAAALSHTAEKRFTRQAI